MGDTLELQGYFVFVSLKINTVKPDLNINFIPQVCVSK